MSTRENLAEKTKEQLIELAKQVGVNVLVRDTKDQMIEKIAPKLKDFGKSINKSKDADDAIEEAPIEEPPKAKPVELKGEPVTEYVSLDDEHKIYAALAVDLPEKAVERTDGKKTGKGYNTTGYKYQYVVNRFNEVLGMRGWWYTYRILDTSVMKSSKGYARTSITVETTITLSIGGQEVSKVLAGGHISNNYADALKGAITNSFKKTAALFGVGKAAYEVSIDDDNTPASTNAPGVPTSSSGYTTQGQGYVTAKQAEAIGKMAGFLGIDIDAWKKKLNVESFYKLEYKKGSKIIDILMAKVKEKKEKDAADQSVPEEEPTIQMDAPEEIPGGDALPDNDDPFWDSL